MNEYAHEFEYLHVLGFSREIIYRIYIEKNAFIMSNWLMWLWRLSCPKIYRVSEQAENPRELMVLSQLKANRLKTQQELISLEYPWIQVHVCGSTQLLQWCPTLCGPMDYSLPGSSVHGIFQARILEWVAISSPGDLPNPGIKPESVASPALASGFLPLAPPGKSIR